MNVFAAEVLPDEAADRAHALSTQMVDLVELVVLVAEDQVDRVRPDPALVLGERHVMVAGLGDSRLVPDRVDSPALAAAAFCARGPEPGRASTKLSWPSSSSAERSCRATTACPEAIHFETIPTAASPLQRQRQAVGDTNHRELDPAVVAQLGVEPHDRFRALVALGLEHSPVLQDVVEDDQAARSEQLEAGS